MSGLLFAEDVTTGHPDRLADLVAEHLVERITAEDPFASIGIEVAVHRSLVLVTGYLAVGGLLPRALRLDGGRDEWLQEQVEWAVERAGYGGRWPLPVTVSSDLVVEERTHEITDGQGYSCDQDVVVGYATPDDALGNLPLEVVAARAARARLCEVQLERSDLVGPDGKVLVVLRPGPTGAEVEALNISVVHTAETSYEDLYRVVGPAVADALRTVPGLQVPDAVDPSWCTINGAGAFLLPGPQGDGGLSGKKLVVDLYGPRVPIGGGALCGKDAYKADRCGPLRSRQLAVRLSRTTGTEATVWAGWFPGQERAQFIWARLGDGRELDAAAIDRLVGLPDLSIKGTAAELELLRQPWSSVVQRGYVGAGHPWDC